MKELVKLKVFYSNAEAELAKGYLENNGISAEVVADDNMGHDPFFTSVTASGVYLYVAKKDVEKANALLKKVK